jgi:glycosyltransferase involved in cell wall biosynthesis
MLYPSRQDWLEQFPGTTTGFRKIQECRFEGDELIVAVGMTISAEMTALESVRNAKVQYIHGATPWAPELMQRALSIPLPKIIVASYLKEIIETIGGGEILALVHNAVDCDDYFSSAPEGSDGVGFIYSSHPAKDPATTLGVIETLSRVHPGLCIRVFGADRRPWQISRRMYSRYPSLQEARQIYTRSQVWVMASASEGFSMPVLEAMACGCCVVATDCGGTRDIVIHGENGFLVPTGDVGAILDKVELLLGDSHLRTCMRQQAKETAQRFNWEESIDKLEAALGTLQKQSFAVDEATI